MSARQRVLLVVVLMVGFAASWWFQNLPKPAQPVSRTPVVAEVLDDPGSPTAGPPDATVTIVIFTDYRCAICQATAPALDRLLARDRGVRVIFKDWPIRGPGSTAAAHAALAAQYQGRYLLFHRALMASRGPLDPPRIDRIAADAGLDVARLRADQAIHAAAIDAQLARHKLQAFSLGLEGTPAYLVGSYLIQGGLDDGQLTAAVRRARRAADQTG
jgi:protein-disulfide isomerase